MLPSPTRTESFTQTFDARNELSTPSGDTESVSPPERRMMAQDSQNNPIDISKSGRLSAVKEECPPPNIASLVDQALCTNKRAFDIHSKLSGILFDLRQQSLGCLTLMQQGGLAGLDRTYMCVATLCEAIHSLQNLVEQQCGLADYEYPYALEAQLAFLAVTTVLDIYENYYSRFATPATYHANYHRQHSIGVDSVWGIDESSLERERMSDPSYFSSAASQYPLEGSISQRLGQLVHLTVMDFHLGQLQCIFQPSRLPPASEGFTWEKYEINRLRLQSLRGSLQADIQVVKRGI